MVPNGDCTTVEPPHRSEAHYFRYTSIAHFPSIEQRGPYIIARQTIQGEKWVGLYRGTPTRCEHLANFRERKALVNGVTGKRFATIERAIAHYANGGTGW